MIVNHNLMSFMSNLCIKSNFDIFPGATNNNDNNTNINKNWVKKGASTALQLSLAR